MKSRNHFHQSWSVTIVQIGWLLAMVMMFIFVSPASGKESTSELSQFYPRPRDSSALASAVFDPATHMVTVKATAPATAWDATATIGPRSLLVYEDGVRQSIADVKLLHSPLSIGLLLENGGRYRALNEIIAQNVSDAARDLMGAVDPDDHVQLWTYADNVQPMELPSSSASPGVHTYQLNVPVPPSSESNLFDALMTTIPQVAQLPGRKVLIVVSSGYDSFSNASFFDVLQKASTSGVPVCVINIARWVQSNVIVSGADSQNPYASIRSDQDTARLKKLAEVSGCRALAPDSSLALPALYDELLGNLRLEYDIHYRSDELKRPGIRQVRVQWLSNGGEESATSENATHSRRIRELARTQYEVTALSKTSTQTPARPAPLSAGLSFTSPLNGRERNALAVPMRKCCTVASTFYSPNG